ncbi:MAG: FHA domain-containing protein [Firmicutes bacterium]|nr:FHA domain-containing protein [Bacillota bacterium]
MLRLSARLGTLIAELKGKLQLQDEDNDLAQDDQIPTKPYVVIKPSLAYLLLEGGEQKMVSLHPGFLIGRGASCHLVLADPSASRVHASFSWQGEAWLIQDNRSTNGTLVNGTKIRGTAPLRSGDRIQIGQTVLTYEER